MSQWKLRREGSSIIAEAGDNDVRVDYFPTLGRYWQFTPSIAFLRLPQRERAEAWQAAFLYWSAAKSS
ncbi:MAG: hypothetical protein ACK4GK_12540 [Ferrovibrio sp.]